MSRILVLLAIVSLIVACDGETPTPCPTPVATPDCAATALAERTPYPTYTLWPTYTPGVPTATVAATSTPGNTATAAATGTQTPTRTTTVTVQPTAPSGPTATPAPLGALLPRVLWVQDDWARFDYANPDALYTWKTASGQVKEYRGHPEFGPIGGVIQYSLWWDRIEGSPQGYDWSYIQQTLLMGREQPITLDDGTVIAKPYIFTIGTSEQTGSTRICNNDRTPGWVKKMAPSLVFTATCAGSVVSAYAPNVCDKDWKAAYFRMVRAMGAEFDNNPEWLNFAGVVIGWGVASETQLAKGCSCLSTSTPPCYWGFLAEAMAVYAEAFPHKIVWATALQGNTQIQVQARTLPNKTVGIRCCGWGDDSKEDVIWHGSTPDQLYLDGGKVGFSFGTAPGDSRSTWQVIPTGLEPGGIVGGTGGTYWTFLNGLAAHAHFFDIQYADELGSVFVTAYRMETETGFPLLRFARDHLARTAVDTPDVWIVFRETQWPVLDCPSWAKGLICRGGKLGNHEFFLYERTTSRVIPHAQLSGWVDVTHPYSYANARATNQAAGSLYMSLDIEDNWPTARVESAWAVTVTLANTGTDTLGLEYMNRQGQIVEIIVRKGPGLGAVGTWVDVPFVLHNAAWANGLPGSTDLRISCRGDGDELVHRVIVRPVL